jgi:endo-1,4-beta-xylanase
MHLSRRTFLASAAALAAFPAASDDIPLRARAARKGLAYGACAATSHFADAPFIQALTREAGLLVPEWEAKRGRLERRQGEIDFSAADRLAGFAENHGMGFRGHALVWHVSNPAWLDAALDRPHPPEALLTDYITTVAGHFRGRVQSWDVVNEAIDVDGGRPDGLRPTRWLSAFGPDYLDTAFHAARAADPQALLVYNDYGLETADPWQSQRRRALLPMLEGFRRRNVPCGAVGLQAHLKPFNSRFDERIFAGFLTEIAAMGYQILLTELDVNDAGGPAAPGQRDRASADFARRVLDVALDQQATRAVVTWGLSDRYTWLAGARPLPLDRNLNRKPFWHAIAGALDGAPPRIS